MAGSSNAFTLEGKRVLLVGAAQGIGAGCARVFADLGATLCLADVDARQLEQRAVRFAPA